jgi:hypothetical protein
MQISKKAIDKVMASNKAQAAIMSAFNVGQKCVQNWLNKNDVRLTTPMAVNAIAKETGLAENEIIETTTVAA